MAWQTFARAGVPVGNQPSASAMQRLLEDMQVWQTTNPGPWSNEHASQWLWCTWLGKRSARPLHDSPADGPVDWHQSPWRALGTELARRLREEPDADLRTHFEELLAPQ